jgi:hypothetical protein
MSINKIQYRFSTKPWRYTGQAGWIFISLPKKISKEIRNTFKPDEQGWGRLPVTARIGNTEWKTAIWFDTKADTYLLPLKSEIRKKENLVIDKIANVIVLI